VALLWAGINKIKTKDNKGSTWVCRIHRGNNNRITMCFKWVVGNNNNRMVGMTQKMIFLELGREERLSRFKEEIKSGIDEE